MFIKIHFNLTFLYRMLKKKDNIIYMLINFNNIRNNFLITILTENYQIRKRILLARMKVKNAHICSQKLHKPKSPHTH